MTRQGEEMTQIQPRTDARSAPQDAARLLASARRRWLILAVFGLAMLVFSYVLFVQTVAGQALENAALRGADELQVAARQAAYAELSRISVQSLVVAVSLLALIGLYRRRLDLIAAGIGTVFVSLGIAQVLKRFMLPRPHLVDAAAKYLDNSFPSGHTTIAMSVVLALIIMTGHRVRGWLIFLAASYVLSVGAWTLTAKWHRLSDTFGAEGLVLAVASLASLWLLERGSVRPTGPRWTWPSRLLAALLLLAGLLSLGLGVYMLVRAGIPAFTPPLTRSDPERDYLIFLALNSLASAGSNFTALLFWWSWRGLETGEIVRGGESTITRGPGGGLPDVGDSPSSPG
jgi:membrane-associated phospholipid phosphatase